MSCSLYSAASARENSIPLWEYSADGRMLKDDRVKGMEHRSLFAEKDTTDKLDDRRQLYAQQ